MTGTGVHIMIVEDSAVQAAVLKKLLQTEGYQVSVASHGRQALELLSQGLPEILISDIDMPEMDGYELCQAVKGDPRTRHIPVILLTNLSDPRNVVKGLQAGADNYVTKPYDGPGLLERIRSLRCSPDLQQKPSVAPPLEISLAGESFTIQAGRAQILNLLLSTFESAVLQNQKLQRSNEQLQIMHRELAEKNRELEQAIETQNRFIGMAAHDMRNPLTVAQGYSQLLLEGALGTLEPTQEKVIRSIHKASESLLQLVNELLEISEIESGNLRLELGPTNLPELVHHAVEMNGFLAKKKDIQISEELDALPPLTLDSAKIEQVLNNLLSNAAKFSHSGTEIKVALRAQDDGGARITVADQGQGIPPGELSNIFLPFQKTSVRGTAGEKSTGLGLAIVKRIVEGHGGTITVESQPGQGSCFSVSLPPS